MFYSSFVNNAHLIDEKTLAPTVTEFLLYLRSADVYTLSEF